jgi:hypothetical protein
VRRTTEGHRGWAATAAALHRLGVRPPCRLTGRQSIPIAFYAGCSALAASGHNANTTRRAITRTARHLPVAALARPGSKPPGYARDWVPHRVGGLYAYVAPGAGSRTP